ncbi:heavy-metal-associated domain-containing protein [Aureimonas ureilytica]|uniref:heavy-metal-associated domain-containing protein n=1 Tax=Aureimonas ureilytica TaxID=401562 RepID=UPI00039EE234|nr:heavy-metal-associated domain-containing protein [Aureimonas ureilytica]
MRLRIDDMTCDGCARAVTRTIQRLDPEAQVAVDRPGGTADVTTKAEGEALVSALTKAGYPAEVLAA